MTSLGILVRTLTCFALVFATWNPTGYSYLTWLRSGQGTAPELAVAGTVLLASHILFFRIAWLSLGIDGVVAALVVMVAGLLALAEFDVVNLWQASIWGYLLPSGLALILALGTVWSLVKRRVVGQSNYLNPPP